MLAGRPVPRNLRHRPRRRGGIGVLVRVITGPYQRSGLNVAETEAESLIPQIGKFFGRVEASNWKVIFRGTQVLTYGENIYAACAEVAENFHKLF